MRVMGKKNMTVQQAATRSMLRREAAGASPGTIRGIGRNREAEVKRLRDFATYSKARAAK